MFDINAVRICLNAIFIAGLLSISSGLEAASCSGGGPRPQWVDKPDWAGDDYHYGVGVSDDTSLAMADRLAVARQGALKALSETIEVTVKNSLVQEQASRRQGSVEIAETAYQSVTKTTTSASLQNVEVVSTWEDSANCAIWLRARVSKQQVERSRKVGLAKTLFGLFSEHLGNAQNVAVPASGRLSALESALDLLPRISLDLVPEASSSGYYSNLLRRLQKDLSQAQDDTEFARRAIRESDAAVNRASEQTDEAVRSKLLVSASSGLRSLLTRFPDGLAGMFGPGDIYFKLGELEEIRGNTCGAKSNYLTSADTRHVGERLAIARKRADGLACSPEDMEKSIWRQQFEGRRLLVVCYYRANEEQALWNKACDGINSIVRPFGAEVSTRVKKLSAAQLKSIQDGELPSGIVDRGESMLAVVASGKMANRVDKDGARKTVEYQFDGALGTVLIDDGKLLFSDRFQGKTGWNPVSAEMVMDVLAINVVKRWKEKFGRFLRRESN